MDDSGTSQFPASGVTAEMIAAGARPLRQFGMPGELAEHLARRVFLEMVQIQKIQIPQRLLATPPDPRP